MFEIKKSLAIGGRQGILFESYGVLGRDLIKVEL